MKVRVTKEIVVEVISRNEDKKVMGSPKYKTLDFVKQWRPI